jgi:hypothetical protein
VRELSLHLLDIAENSVAANATQVKLTVIEDEQTDLLQMSVEDNGKGMDAETVAKITDPFVTSRTTRKVGLGLPLLKEAAEACNGFLKISSQPGIGTQVKVQFQRSHIDRMPLGNLAETYVQLLILNPQINWIFVYHFNENVFELDDREIKPNLEGIALTEPDIIAALRKMIAGGIRSAQTGDSE